MKNNDLEKIWMEIEAKKCSNIQVYQRMICVEMLYRVYVGSFGLPSRRYISIEIPEDKKAQFDTFSAPRGFTFTISVPSVKHEGFVACVLQSAAHDQNDVFTIVVMDILQELSRQTQGAEYVKCLRQRIDKWRNFFKNNIQKKLSEEMVIGLWGELNVISELHNDGVKIASDLWKGPIKSAQDFQGSDIALEVKTTAAAHLDYVNISSEMQLDDTGRQALFLIALRIERDDTKGITLPTLVAKVADELPDQQRKRFYAALLCLGYSSDDSEFYKKGYVLKEQSNYQIKQGFPRLLRSDMPQGVQDLTYGISLSNCGAYLIEWDCVIAAIKEYEYGQS